MAAPNLEPKSAYSIGYSVSKNAKSTHNFGTDESPDERTVYTCSIAATAETKYEQGSTGVFQKNRQPALSVALIYTDGKAYKETEWTGPEVGAAIKVALDSVETNIKNTYGTGA
jgi:hypothetical protein